MTMRLADHAYIAATIVLTVLGQVALRWRMRSMGALPEGAFDKLRFLLSALTDPVVFSGFAAAFVAGLAWMAAMTKFELAYAYPFMSLNFAIVLLLSGWVLAEPVSMTRLAGVALIVAGTIVAARG